MYGINKPLWRWLPLWALALTSICPAQNDLLNTGWNVVTSDRSGLWATPPAPAGSLEWTNYNQRIVQTDPAVAYGDGRFLVAWTEEAWDPFNWRRVKTVRGALVSENGWIQSTFDISPPDRWLNRGRPRIAFGRDPNTGLGHFVVVYEEWSFHSVLGSQIRAAVVSGYGVRRQNQFIANPAPYALAPDIAFDGYRFLVVFEAGSAVEMRAFKVISGFEFQNPSVEFLEMRTSNGTYVPWSRQLATPAYCPRISTIDEVASGGPVLVTWSAPPASGNCWRNVTRRIEHSKILSWGPQNPWLPWGDPHEGMGYWESAAHVLSDCAPPRTSAVPAGEATRMKVARLNGTYNRLYVDTIGNTYTGMWTTGTGLLASNLTPSDRTQYFWWGPERSDRHANADLVNLGLGEAVMWAEGNGLAGAYLGYYGNPEDVFRIESADASYYVHSGSRPSIGVGTQRSLVVWEATINPVTPYWPGYASARIRLSFINMPTSGGFVTFPTSPWGSLGNPFGGMMSLAGLGF